MILSVMPVREYHTSLNQCFASRVGKANCLVATRNMPKNMLARKNRQKARVYGGMFVRDHLNIGEAKPQIMLAIIRAMMPFWTEVILIFIRPPLAASQEVVFGNNQGKSPYIPFSSFISKSIVTGFDSLDFIFFSCTTSFAISSGPWIRTNATFFLSAYFSCFSSLQSASV